MSEDYKKNTGSGRPSGGSASKSGSSARSGSSTKSGSSAKSSSATRSSSSAKSGSSAKSSSAARSSSSTKSSSSAKGSSTTKSGSASKSGSAKSTSSGSTKSTGKSTSDRSKRSTSAAGKRRDYDDIPYNPRRDSQAERDLHNSPSARRIAEERRRRTYKKNRRLYNIMFYAAITVAVISVVMILSFTVLFNISDITVERGRNIPYTDEDIVLACGIEPGDNLFAIDTEQAILDVTTTLPYIEVCNISRKLPSTLELDVHSAVVLGRLTTTDGSYIVLSASGRALEYADAYDGSPIARINGMNVSFSGIGSPVELEEPELLDVAAELVVGYSLYGISLDSITFESSGSVSVGYDQRITINIGVPTDLSQKIQVSASMISDGKIAKNESGILDLSIDKRAVFTPDYLLDDE